MALDGRLDSVDALRQRQAFHRLRSQGVDVVALLLLHEFGEVVRSLPLAEEDLARRQSRAAWPEFSELRQLLICELRRDPASDNQIAGAVGLNKLPERWGDVRRSRRRERFEARVDGRGPTYTKTEFCITKRGALRSLRLSKRAAPVKVAKHVRVRGSGIARATISAVRQRFMPIALRLTFEEIVEQLKRSNALLPRRNRMTRGTATRALARPYRMTRDFVSAFYPVWGANVTVQQIRNSRRLQNIWRRHLHR